ncbi:MAG: small basic protein [Sedimentisphaerales bacterium]|nr:small basic protein [Sedimentisphaerales bacterium]
MSIDRSLKSADSLSRHRNVLTREERLLALADEDKWEEGKDSVFGLPKVSHRKAGVGKKSQKPGKETD